LIDLKVRARNVTVWVWSASGPSFIESKEGFPVLKTLERFLFGIFKTLTSLMLVFASILVFAEVFFRYIVGQAHGWSEELLRYLLIWMTFLGIYLAAKEDKHLGIKVFFDRLPSKLRVPVKWAGDLLIITMFVVFTILGIQYAVRFSSDSSPLLQISLGLIYMVMPIGGILFILQTLFNNMKKKKSDEVE